MALYILGALKISERIKKGKGKKGKGKKGKGKKGKGKKGKGKDDLNPEI